MSYGTATEREFQDGLNGLILYALESLEDEGSSPTAMDLPDVQNVVSFEDVGLLTGNAGLIVRLTDGSEYQLTIIQRK